MAGPAPCRGSDVVANRLPDDLRGHDAPDARPVRVLSAVERPLVMKPVPEERRGQIDQTNALRPQVVVEGLQGRVEPADRNRHVEVRREPVGVDDALRCGTGATMSSMPSRRSLSAVDAIAATAVPERGAAAPRAAASSTAKSHPSLPVRTSSPAADASAASRAQATRNRSTSSGSAGPAQAMAAINSNKEGAGAGDGASRGSGAPAVDGAAAPATRVSCFPVERVAVRRPAAGGLRRELIRMTVEASISSPSNRPASS